MFPEEHADHFVSHETQKAQNVYKMMQRAIQRVFLQRRIRTRAQIYRSYPLNLSIVRALHLHQISLSQTRSAHQMASSSTGAGIIAHVTAEIPARAQEVLDFWFGSKDAPDYLQFRKTWFSSTPEFDAEIHERFDDLLEAALHGGLREWESNADSLLAKIIVLDQFARNTKRGTAGAFAGDTEALRLAVLGCDSGLTWTLPKEKIIFALMPFMHTEDLAMQDRGAFVEWPKLPGYDTNTMMQDQVKTHRDMVVRFGRFPHRNAALARESTPEEVEFVAGMAHRYGQDHKPVVATAKATL